MALTETKNRIVRTINLVDDVFDDNQTRNYALAIQIGLDGLSAAVLDDVLGRVIALEKFTIQSVHQFNILARFIDQIIQQSSILAYPYKKINVALVSPKSTLVPDALFAPEKSISLLSFNHKLEEDEIVLADNLMNLSSKNVFAIPRSVQQVFTELYANATFEHYSSALIETLLVLNKNSTEKKVIVNVHALAFEVVVIKGKELLLYNTFTYKSPEDFIYYVLFVCEQLQLNPETLVLEVVGEIEKDSALYQVLYKYIRNVKFGVRPDTFNYGTKLGSLPKHHHFSLYAQFVHSSGLF